MENNLEELLGSWIQAIGTVIDAITVTPINKFPKTIESNLFAIGNVMQATGNALIADSIQDINLDKIGNSIQTIGNLTIVSGILMKLNEEKEIEFFIKGNLLQALGSILSPFSVSSEPQKMDRLLLDLGSILQAIGNSLQAISGMIVLSGEKEGKIELLGSWIQAGGAVLQALVLTIKKI